MIRRLRDWNRKHKRAALAREINDLRVALGMAPDVTFDDIDDTDVEWARWSARRRAVSDS